MANYRQFRFEIPEARRLASLAGAATDMRSVIEYCNRLEVLWKDLRNLDFPLYDALSSAAAVRYGRCFKSGARGRLPEDALLGEAQDLQNAHRFVVDLRDKHIAHSVNPFEENDVTVQIGDHFASSAEITAVNTAQGRAIGFPSDQPAQLRSLAEWWLRWLEAEMDKERALLIQLVRTFSLDALKANEQRVLASDTSSRTVGKARTRP